MGFETRRIRFREPFGSRRVVPHPKNSRQHHTNVKSANFRNLRFYAVFGRKRVGNMPIGPSLQAGRAETMVDGLPRACRCVDFDFSNLMSGSLISANPQALKVRRNFKNFFVFGVFGGFKV